MFTNKQEKITAEEVSNSSNIIGKGTVLEGNIESFGNIRVEGKVIGSVKTKSKIALGQSSFVEGNMYAQNAEIAGEVEGTVQVTELLVLKPTALIHGDIVAGKLIVESGAVFNGSCKMGGNPEEIQLSDNGQQSEEPSTEGKSDDQQKAKSEAFSN